MEKVYDVLILGAGPAGLSAGLYAARAGMSTLIIEKSLDGGQIAAAGPVENYPGSMLDNEDGFSLTSRMTEQAKRFGCARASDTIKSVSLDGDIKRLIGKKGEYLGKTLIIAVGSAPKKLGCAGEEEHIGSGVSYCATCDAPFFRKKPVFVVGSGARALEEAKYLTDFADSVTIIHRSEKMEVSDHALSAVSDKIKFIPRGEITEIIGENRITQIRVRNVDSGQERLLENDGGAMGVFVFVDYLPQTAVFSDYLPLKNGYILTDESMETGIPGVFAAGDVRVKELRQVVTAAADGAIAATRAMKYAKAAPHNS